MNKIMDFVSNGIPFRSRIVEQGDKYGLNDSLVNMNADPVIEFYDRRYNHSENGQFVSRYSMITLLEHEKDNGLCLQGGVPDWNITADSMFAIVSWLEEFEATTSV
jgi:hypothetical protein